MQNTSFGAAELSCFIEVKKQNGEVKYYRVVNDSNIELSEEDYLKVMGVK